MFGVVVYTGDTQAMAEEFWIDKLPQELDEEPIKPGGSRKNPDKARVKLYKFHLRERQARGEPVEEFEVPEEPKEQKMETEQLEELQLKITLAESLKTLPGLDEFRIQMRAEAIEKQMEREKAD